VPRLAVSSSLEEWAEQGQHLFEHKRYPQAMHCFERACRPREAAVANAYFLRESARSTQNAIKRSEAFLIAADAFLTCAADAKKEKRVYLRNAAECFAHGGDNARAAHTYISAGEFTLAVEHYHKDGMVEDVVRVINCHGNEVKPDVVNTVIGVARLFYLREHKLKYVAMQSLLSRAWVLNRKARELFSSNEEVLEFTEEHDFDAARVEVLEEIGRKAEAAELHLQAGRTLEAISLFLEDSHDTASIRRGQECILQELWRYLGFGITRKSAANNPTLIKLLHLGGQLDGKFWEPNLSDEVRPSCVHTDTSFA
jgi:tetratricopeptide (TPR) repeat protein